MTRRLIDYDSFTGISTYHEYNDLDKTSTIIETVDLQPLRENTYELRKDDDATKTGIKKGQWLYARIHPLEQTRFLRKYGYSVFDKSRERETLKILNTDPEFQVCKTTRGRHG